MAFLTMGVIQAAYGPSFPFLQARYGVSGATVAWIASAHFLGSATAPLLAGVALSLLSTRRVVVGGLLVLALGALLLAFAPIWGLAVTGALTCGLGLGMVSAAMNTAYASLGTRPSNFVNSIFGVGSLLAPLLVAATAPHSLALPFVGVAVLVAFTLGAVWYWGVPDVPLKTNPAHSGQSPRDYLPAIALFPLILAAYVGLEAGFGAWLGQHLGSLGWQNPALITSGFWAGLTLGRFLTGVFGGRVSPPHVVLGAALLTAVFALLAYLMPGWAGGAYVLAGLSMGPVFATTLAWMSHVLAPRFVPFLLVSGSVGGMISPALIGWAVQRGGAGWIPLTLALLGSALTLLVLVTLRVTAGRMVNK